MILIIGYGNSLRQDDGAGLLLARKLEQAWREHHVAVARIGVHQLAPELAAAIAGESVQTVVFVDTEVADPNESGLGIRVYPLEADSISPSLGHHLTPAALLVYARLLYGKQPPAWQVAIPGVAFDHGETLSATTQRALATAQDILADWLAQVATIAPAAAR